MISHLFVPSERTFIGANEDSIHIMNINCVITSRGYYASGIDHYFSIEIWAPTQNQPLLQSTNSRSNERQNSIEAGGKCKVLLLPSCSSHRKSPGLFPRLVSGSNRSVERTRLLFFKICLGFRAYVVTRR